MMFGFDLKGNVSCVLTGNGLVSADEFFGTSEGSSEGNKND